MNLILAYWCLLLVTFGKAVPIQSAENSPSTSNDVLGSFSLPISKRSILGNGKISLPYHQIGIVNDLAALKKKVLAVGVKFHSFKFTKSGSTVSSTKSRRAQSQVQMGDGSGDL